MNKFKSEIVFISFVSIIIILFPPMKVGEYDAGYSFFFSAGNFYYSINYGKLILEFILLFLFTGLIVLVKPFLKSTITKIKNRKKIILYSVTTFFLTIISLSSIIVWYLFSDNVIGLIEPKAIKTIENKYEYELSNLMDDNPNKYFDYDYKHNLTFSELFDRILQDDLKTIGRMDLPDRLLPDIKAYLSDYVPQANNSDDTLSTIRWDLVIISFETGIQIPFNKTITKENEIKYLAVYDSVKNDYLKTVRADAKTYIKDYDNYTWWKNLLRILGFFVLSILTIYILYQRLKRVNF